MNRTNARGGFTLLEVMVSLLIFNIAALGIAQSFLVHLKRNTENERRGESVQVAQQVMDEIRVKDPTSLPHSGSTTQDVTLGHRTYEVTTTYCKLSAYCTSNNIRSVSVEVSLEGNLQYAADTVFAQLR
jgi:prepilin-type N-terminal cleavage/methylation domain-containing protein